MLNEIAPAAVPVAVESGTEAIRMAVAQHETDLARVRSLIADLRPVTLDELGVEAAIEDLAERARSHGVAVRLGVDLAYEQGERPAGTPASSKPRSTESSKRPSRIRRNTAAREPRRSTSKRIRPPSASPFETTAAVLTRRRQMEGSDCSACTSASSG